MRKASSPESERSKGGHAGQLRARARCDGLFFHAQQVVLVDQAATPNRNSTWAKPAKRWARTRVAAPNLGIGSNSTKIRGQTIEQLAH